MERQRVDVVLLGYVSLPNTGFIYNNICIYKMKYTPANQYLLAEFFLFLIGSYTSICPSSVSDCQALLDIGHLSSGKYNVTPKGTRFGYEVYCDMDTDGGGWLVGYNFLFYSNIN